ncbi:hypothetical protein M885DRAFT_626788 [Pelagophyceae sp. CCMP2097]|nr:hypothetical protein M885DRAFT_626788 [Pelagophyceae sp. CCMP2097]
MPSMLRVVLAFAIAARASALSPVIKVAGQGMNLLKPIFGLESAAQAAILGGIGGVDGAEVDAELDAIKAGCVIYTYGLSPFSTEALSTLEAEGAIVEVRQLGLEWFLLGPRASVLRQKLGERTGQTALPHIFIGGESVGGLATGTPGLSALIEAGSLQAMLKKAKALR